MQCGFSRYRFEIDYFTIYRYLVKTKFDRSRVENIPNGSVFSVFYLLCLEMFY